MEIIFHRDALYSEIWSTPISTLCRKYQLSDNGLRKVCKELSIPLPVRGHWAKVAAGHTVKTTPLPPTTSCITFTSRPALPIDVRQQEDPLATQISFEKTPGNKIVVPEVLDHPHALVASSSRAIEKLRSILEKSRLASGRWKNRSPNQKWKPSFYGREWQDHERRGLLLDPTNTVLPLRISLESVDRALRIWDAFIKAAIARGMKVGTSDKHRLTLSKEKNTIELRMSEHVIKGQKSKNLLDHSQAQQTGELRIFVCYGGERKFSDGTKGALENQLNAIFCNVHQVFSEKNAWDAMWIEKKRLTEIAHENSEIERLGREAVKRLAEEEKHREHELIGESQAWHQAQQIRAYVLSLQTAGSAGAIPKHGFDQWAVWASEVADRLDPSHGHFD